MKKVAIILSVLSIFFLVGCDNQPVVNPDPPGEETSYKAFDEVVINDVIVRNHNVAYYDNIYHVYLDVVNENNVDVHYSTVTIRYYNDTALIHSTTQNITPISAHGSVSISFDIDINLVNANKVEYVIQ